MRQLDVKILTFDCGQIDFGAIEDLAQQNNSVRQLNITVDIAQDDLDQLLMDLQTLKQIFPKIRVIKFNVVEDYTGIAKKREIRMLQEQFAEFQEELYQIFNLTLNGINPTLIVF